MTLAELKTAVRAQFDGNHETANQWVKANFGDLRLKSTWQAAYDRCSEFIAAATDVAIPAAKTAVNAITTAIYWFIVAMFFVYFAGQALRQWWDSAPVPRAKVSADAWLESRRDPLLSSTVKIAA
jgi:hypothetical protein